MMYTTMTATVSGTNCEGNPFSLTCEFTLIPPKDSNHYGTGYYMRVEAPGIRDLLDVRYERTTDISVLADRWIRDYFGKNAKEVVKEFPEAPGILATRRKYNLTQAQLCRITGIPTRTIQNWESGQRKCPDYVLDLIEYKLMHECK
jgi:DNA-binding transcriptional regulator YiaG